LIGIYAQATSVTRAFDSSRERIRPIYAIATEEVIALEKLKEQTIDFGGDTLLIGPEGLQALNEYIDSREEPCGKIDLGNGRYSTGCSLDDTRFIAVKKQTDNRTVYIGAALDCE